MSSDFILALMQETVRVTLVVAGPLLLISLVVGLVIAVIQAATQLHEMTLVFVPKMVAVIGGLLLVGSFMLDTLAQFLRFIFDLVARVGSL